jgi:hypothetical protein
MEILYTEVAGEGLATLWAAFTGGVVVTLIVSPKGNDAGEWTWTGSVLITEPELAFDGTSGDPVIVTCGFEGSGELAQAAVATA